MSEMNNNANMCVAIFVISVISSLILINYGLEKYKIENLIAGIFFIYLSLMNLFQYFVWTDINDLVWNGNSVISQITAFFIYTQPVVLYLLKLFIVQPTAFNWIYAVIELMFLSYAIFCFRNYSILQKQKSSFPDKKTGLFEWSWFNYIDFIIYFSFMIFSIFIYVDFRYAILACIWLFSILDLSYLVVPNYYGALYYVIAAISPILVLLWQWIFM
jgi:hypothetical protein